MQSLPDNKTEVSESKAVLAYSLLGVLPFSMLLFMPMFVGGFVTDLGFNDRSAGLIASFNLGGAGLAAFAAFWWVRMYSIRAVLSMAFMIFIAANFLSAFISDFISLAIIRFIEGMAAGTITSGIVAAIAKTRSPDRNYGFWLAAQLLYGTLGFLGIPLLFTNYGVTMGFMLIAILACLTLPLIRFMPTKAKQTDSVHPNITVTRTQHPLWGVVALFVFYVGLNVVWAYLERIGDQAGLSIATIGTSLSIANFAGLAGAILVAMIDTRFGRFWPITVVLLITSASVLPLLGSPNAVTYATAISIYLFGWIFLVPLMLGAIAELDNSGRYVTLANAGLGVGLALGPFIGALMVGESQNYNPNIYLGSILMAVSLIIILPILKTTKKHQ